jgi:L-asparaginase II
MRSHATENADTIDAVAISDGDVVLAHVVRSGVVESVHRGHAVIVDREGDVLASWGNPDALVLPRSANKPLQAAAMVRAGLSIDSELLALASASHSGEQFHIDGARRILTDAGLDESALLTPPDLPYDAVERERFLADGNHATPIVMNCSGKHAAMLVTCQYNGWSLTDYTSIDHPLQQLIQSEIEDAAGEKIWATATDGCGAPLLGVSLRGLARMGAAAVAAPPDSPRRYVADAMRAYPAWVSGTRRDSGALMAGVPGLLAKEGADGVYLVALADGRSIALKITDGADRARSPIMARLLRSIDVNAAILDEQECVPIFGGGREVGYIRGVF